MTEIYFPFDSGQGSGVTEAQWSNMARYWLTPGVIPQAIGLPALHANPLQVFGDSSGMQVKVRSGAGWNMGHLYQTDTEKTVAVSAADATNPRIDRVVLRVYWPNNIVFIWITTGTPAGSPIAPALSQTSTTSDIPLAQVRVNAGVSTITAANVTDERQWAGDVSRPVLAKVDPLAVATASIDITGLPPIFRTLEIHIKCRGDTAAVSTSLRLRFNGDLGANYDTQILNGTGSPTAATSQTFGATSVNCGGMPANTALANLFATHTIRLIGYADDQNKVVLSNTAYKHNITSGTMEASQAAGHWRSNAVITQITIFPLAQNFAIGTTMEIYGVIR